MKTKCRLIYSHVLFMIYDCITMLIHAHVNLHIYHLPLPFTHYTKKPYLFFSLKRGKIKHRYFTYDFECFSPYAFEKLIHTYVGGYSDMKDTEKNALIKQDQLEYHNL